MASWIASGHLVEAIILLTAGEWLGLTLYHWRTGHGPDAWSLGSILLPGVFLLIALRSALVGADWMWVAGALTLALFAHVADLARRWNR